MSKYNPYIRYRPHIRELVKNQNLLPDPLDDSDPVHDCTGRDCLDCYAASMGWTRAGWASWKSIDGKYMRTLNQMRQAWIDDNRQLPLFAGGSE